jgi:hypothetical protein
MAEWHEFYTLVGTTAGVLIGLIFIVVSLGADHAIKGDEHRVRVFVTPVLVHFAALLFLALAMVAPVTDLVRGGALGLIGCAGLAYSANIALLAPQVLPAAERQPLWYAGLPMIAFSCLLVSAVAFAAGAGIADEVGTIAAVILLITTLRSSWGITLAVLNRPKSG